MADKENTKQKIKAIYPHIVVGGDIDKPCYNIHWYDIEQKTMICGFGSYKLELVRKWLEEEFEVVERDIDNLIKSQEAEIDILNAENTLAISERNAFQKSFYATVKENRQLKADLKEIGIEYERLDDEVTNGIEVCHECHEKYDKKIKQTKAEAIKELEVKIHEKLHQAEMHGNFEPVVTREMFDSVVKELVGECK